VFRADGVAVCPAGGEDMPPWPRDLVKRSGGCAARSLASMRMFIVSAKPAIQVSTLRRPHEQPVEVEIAQLGVGEFAT
jgi:hypothetical protein